MIRLKHNMFQCSHFILIIILESFASQGKFENRQNGTRIDFEQIYNHSENSRSDVLPTSNEPPSLWVEHWRDHNQTLGRFYINHETRVVVYFDEDLSTSITGKTTCQLQANALDSSPHWLFKFTSDVWAYMTETYGNFGPDPYLYLVVHLGTYSGAHNGYSIDPGNVHEQKNVLDISFFGPRALLTNHTKSEEMTKILNKLAQFVEKSSKGRFGSPSYKVWDSLLHVEKPWVNIFTYDVYTNLNMTTDAENYKKMAMINFNDSPKEFVYWFRDWFWPIYSMHGGVTVLNNYFTLLSQFLPHIAMYYDYYDSTLDVGSFVYFWSAAAKSNLIPLANIAFGWNETYQSEFMRAKARFNIYWEEKPETSATKTGSSKGQLNSNHDKSDVSYGAGVGVVINVVTSTTITTDDTPDHSAATLENKKVFDGASIGMGVMVLLVIILIASFIIIYKRKVQALTKKICALTNAEVAEFFEGVSSLSIEESEDVALYMPFVKDYEIPREHLVLVPEKIIGSGQFGCVTYGFVRNVETQNLIPVAVKTVKTDVEVLHFKAMLSEAKIMAYLGRHEHIVRLIGTYTANIKNREIFIALELCPLGDLLKFLRKNGKHFKNFFDTTEEKWRDLSSQVIGETFADDEYSVLNNISTLELLQWGREISNAMMYLTEKQVIHGDLAARNVLLTANRVAQVSDFGLSRQLINYANYKKSSEGPLPWRWMAIESLNEMKFSVASDVWSFGVTMWEVFSLGKVPYSSWTYNYAFVDRLIRGERLEPPQYANQDVIKLMEDCWKLKPSERLTFKEINEILHKLIVDLEK